MKKLCVFDLDGTLINTLADIAAAMNRALEQLGRPPRPTEEFRSLTGIGALDTCRRALGPGTEEEVQRLHAIYRPDYLSHCCVLSQPYPGIPALLTKLREKGVLLAVLTNKPQDIAKEVLSTLLGPEVFRIIVGQSDQFPLKPDPAALFYIMETLGVSREETCFVGDTYVDITLGERAAVDTVGVAWGFAGAERLREAGAPKIVDTPEELGALLLPEV